MAKRAKLKRGTNKTPFAGVRNNVKLSSNSLPDGWASARLGDICETKTGGTPSRGKKEYYGGKIPWVKSGELEDTVIQTAEETITDAGLSDSNAKVFPRGTILIALYGATVGKTGELGLNAATNQAICALFPNPALLNRTFLLKYLQSERDNLIRKSFGGAQPNISQAIVRDLPIKVPPVSEQERVIAKLERLLDRVERAKVSIEKVPTLLKHFRQAVLAAACSGKLVPQDPNDEPASELLKRIRAERKKKWEEAVIAKGNDPKKRKYEEPPGLDTLDLSELPKGWERVTLGFCSQLVTKGESPRWQGFEYQQNGVLFIRSENVLKGKLDLANAVRIPPKFHAKLKRSQVKSGDVFLTLVGASIGRSAVVPNRFEDANLNQAVALIRLHKAVVPEFLMHVLNSPRYQEIMMSKRVEVARPNISLIDVRELIAPLPPLPEQRRIVAKVEELFKLADTIEASVGKSRRHAEKIKQSLLAKAFRGELVEQDPNDEPASVLLEKIKKVKASVKASDPRGFPS